MTDEYCFYASIGILASFSLAIATWACRFILDTFMTLASAL